MVNKILRKWSNTISLKKQLNTLGDQCQQIDANFKELFYTLQFPLLNNIKQFFFVGIANRNTFFVNKNAQRIGF